MNIKEVDVKSESCNFCTGKYVHLDTGYEPTYGYTEVIQIKRDEVGGLCANICRSCAKELEIYIKRHEG